jgi:hypothetical protein
MSAFVSPVEGFSPAATKARLPTGTLYAYEQNNKINATVVRNNPE